LNVKGVLESGKTKKEVENDLFLNLAPLIGGMLQPFSLAELAKNQEIEGSNLFSICRK
jgi:hypothetical protein